MSGCKVRKMDTSNRVNIVCSIFPEYDWVRNIIGDDDEATTLTLLEKNGLDLHTYQPSDMDISIVSKCNLLVYTGGKSNQWISDIVKASSNSNLKVIDISEILKDQLIPDNSPEGGFDEHLWLSIKNARTVCEYFTQTF